MPFLKTLKTNPPRSTLLDIKTWKSGLRHTVFSLNGDEYKGEWLNNKRHGHGTQVWKESGGIYKGEWKFGKRDGFGTYSIPTAGKAYEKQYFGYWQHGKKHGHGTFYYSNGAFYEGNWREDQRSGHGTLYRESYIYEGQWQKDKFHGHGIMLLANGNRYEGSWEEGEKNGHGKFFYADAGLVYEGYWLNGVPKCGTIVADPNYSAPSPLKFSFPEVKLADAAKVLQEAKSVLMTADKLDRLNSELLNIEGAQHEH
ncbi:MORN repeat-containing protein 3-like [Synchiropus picturatus]